MVQQRQDTTHCPCARRWFISTVVWVIAHSCDFFVFLFLFVLTPFVAAEQEEEEEGQEGGIGRRGR